MSRPPRMRGAPSKIDFPPAVRMKVSAVRRDPPSARRAVSSSTIYFEHLFVSRRLLLCSLLVQVQSGPEVQSGPGSSRDEVQRRARPPLSTGLLPEFVYPPHSVSSRHSDVVIHRHSDVVISTNFPDAFEILPQPRFLSRNPISCQGTSPTAGERGKRALSERRKSVGGRVKINYQYVSPRDGDVVR